MHATIPLDLWLDRLEISLDGFRILFSTKLSDSAPRSVVLQPDRETGSKYAFKEKRPVGRPPRKEQVQPPSSASVLLVVDGNLQRTVAIQSSQKPASDFSTPY